MKSNLIGIIVALSFYPGSAQETNLAPTPAAWVAPTLPIANAPKIWKTADGKTTYLDVEIEKVEADCVTILDSDGGGLIPIATLTPDLQKMLNYNPVAAKAAADVRAKDEVVADQQAGLGAAQAAQDRVDHAAQDQALRAKHMAIYAKQDQIVVLQQDIANQNFQIKKMNDAMAEHQAWAHIQTDIDNCKAKIDADQKQIDLIQKSM